MSETLDELIGGVRAVLTELRYLSEAPAARPFASDLPRSSSFDKPELPKVDALFERHVSRLEDWAVAARHDIAARKRRPPGSHSGETPTEFAQRIIGQYEGVHDLDVKLRENCSRAYVRKIRQRDGRDPRYGRSLDAG